MKLNIVYEKYTEGGRCGFTQVLLWMRTNPARLRQGILCTEILQGPKHLIRKPDRIKKEKYINNSVNVSNDEYHKH